MITLRTSEENRTPLIRTPQLRRRKRHLRVPTLLTRRLRDRLLLLCQIHRLHLRPLGAQRRGEIGGFGVRGRYFCRGV